MTLTNHQFRLAARPAGMPKDSDWKFTAEPVREPGPGEVLVEILYVSLDPAMRGWMNDRKSYIAPVGLGDVMRAGTVGRVIASNNPKFAVGDHVLGMQGVRRDDVDDVDVLVVRHPGHRVVAVDAGLGKAVVLGPLEALVARAGDHGDQAAILGEL